MGVRSMLKPTTSENPELGYMIQKPKAGKGYATQIANEMLKYAFNVLKCYFLIIQKRPEGAGPNLWDNV